MLGGGTPYQCVSHIVDTDENRMLDYEYLVMVDVLISDFVRIAHDCVYGYVWKWLKCFGNGMYLETVGWDVWGYIRDW